MQWFVEREIMRWIDSEGDEVLDLTQERANLARAQRLSAEMDLAHKRGKLVDIEIQAEVWSRLVSNSRARLLNLPSKLAAELPVSNRSEVFESSQRITFDALDELSETEVDLSNLGLAEDVCEQGD